MPHKTHHELDLEVLQKMRIIVQAAQGHSQKIVKSCGISGTKLWLLQELSDRPNLRVGELAEIMSLQSTTISNMLEKLEKKELILREKSSSDKRVVTIKLTSTGVSLLKKAPKPTRGLLPDALRNMSKSEIQKLNIALNALLNEMSYSNGKSAKQPFSFNI